MVAQAQLAYTDLFKANQRITEQQNEIEQLLSARNAARLRADHAEKLYNQLERQLVHAAKESYTLIQHFQKPEDRPKMDKELDERINAGWEIAQETVNTLDLTKHVRIVRFVRTAPIEPATDQPPMTVTVGNPAGAAATPSVTVADPVAFP